MRFNSVSVARATCCSENAARAGSAVHSVKLAIGTSSMPLGLISGVPTPSCGDSQSACDCTVSYRRTSAVWLGTPTSNCTVITAIPGRDTV